METGVRSSRYLPSLLSSDMQEMNNDRTLQIPECSRFFLLPDSSSSCKVVLECKMVSCSMIITGIMYRC